MKARKIISVLITLAMIMSLIPALEASAGEGMPFMDVPYIYYDFNYGGEAYRTSGVREGCFILYDGFDDWNYDIVNPFWYVVVGDVTMDDRVDVEGDVSLILADGCTLTCEEGIRVEEGSSLTIYAQSEGPNTGKLIANGDAYNAGIGSDEPSIYGTYEDCTGDVTIHGGIISATGGDCAAGIGGAYGVNGGNVTIYGGCVTAYSGFNAAAIGGGAFAEGAFGEGGGKGGNVTIWGGEVFAERKPGGGGTGIGSGFGMPNSGSLTVHGGVVNTESLYCTLAIAPGMAVKPCRYVTSDSEISNFTSVFGNRYRYDSRLYENKTSYLNNSFAPEWATWFIRNRACFCVVKPDEPVPYWAYTSKGIYETKATSEKYTFVKNDTKKWGDGWYVVNDSGTFTDPIVIDTYANAKLILEDGVTLNALGGIVLEQGSSLTIYAQSDGENAGKLVVKGKPGYAGIGSEITSVSGGVTVHGGILDVTGGENAPAFGKYGKLTFYGGVLNAKAGAGSSRAFDTDSILLRGGYEPYNLIASKTISKPDGEEWINVLSDAELSLSLSRLSTEGKAPVRYKYWLNDRLGLRDAETTSYLLLDDGYTSFADGVWYVVDHDVTINTRMAANGTVNLILGDDCKLNVPNGIFVGKDSTLNIYGQDKGTGELKVKVTRSYLCRSGIGGGGVESKDNPDCGTVNIHGGIINVTGGTASAGIGGGENGNGGTINIYGGRVTAESGTGGAGIGGGAEAAGGTVNIKSGVVAASGGESASGAGIGGGENADGGIINISGGSVTATGGLFAAGIGGGQSGGAGTVTVSGGKVNAVGEYNGAGIGAGGMGTGGSVTITNGDVTAESEIGASIGGEEGCVEVTVGDNLLVYNAGGKVAILPQGGSWSNVLCGMSYANIVQKDFALINYTVPGAQIRLSGKQGLRFVGEITDNLIMRYDDENNSMLNNKDFSENYGYGFIVLPTNLLGENELTFDIENVAVVPASNVYEVGEGFVRFTVCIVDILPKNYTRDYAVRPYIRYTQNGETKTAYGEQYSTSVHAIAETAYEALKENTPQAILDILGK